MNNLPSDVVDKIYKYSHQMLFSKCMKQLKLYRVHSSLNVSWDFLESAHYVLNGVRIPCFDINNIEASSHNILNLIYYFDLYYIRWDKSVTVYLEHINIID